jgi:hypothetical protein
MTKIRKLPRQISLFVINYLSGGAERGAAAKGKPGGISATRTMADEIIERDEPSVHEFEPRIISV